uniref:Uncharacterized protein n=1 Tax=Manihot esculenta TaxID=3983 RepID=A0A2C9VSX9_MANES
MNHCSRQAMLLLLADPLPALRRHSLPLLVDPSPAARIAPAYRSHRLSIRRLPLALFPLATAHYRPLLATAHRRPSLASPAERCYLLLASLIAHVDRDLARRGRSPSHAAWSIAIALLLTISCCKLSIAAC